MACLPICMTVVGQRTVREGRGSVSMDGSTVHIEMVPTGIEYMIRHEPNCSTHNGGPHE